jgi:glycosidase
VARSAIYEVFVRDFSPAGNFRGVIQGLDRVQSTGANTIWLMPIYPVGVANRKGPLGSPYAVQDYRGIDSSFGTAADLHALIEAVHSRGMKLILDWVPNHTAWDNVWVTQHPDFYLRDSTGGLMVPRDPQGKLTDWTDVADLDYENPALRRAMIDAMRYWLDEFGIDGFRVDAAGFVPYDFWGEALPQLRASVPRRLLLLAEWGDLEMHRLGFDLTYAWDSYSRLKAVWKGSSASTFVRGELADMEAMPAGGMRLRFTTNHDETGWDNPPVTIFGQGAGARAAFTAMALLPGRPLIYNGQEVESAQKLRLFYQDSIVWAQPDAANARNFYRTVLTLTETNPNFLTGSFKALTTSAPRDVISYRRGDVAVLVNTRARPVTFTVTGFAVRGAHDLLTDRVLEGSRVRLQPHGALVLERRSTSGAVPTEHPQPSSLLLPPIPYGVTFSVR